MQILGALNLPLTMNPTNVSRHELTENDVTLPGMITFAKTLNQRMRDAEKYRTIPSELRMFLESDNEAMFTLGLRLTEAVNARDQVIIIREYIDMAKGNSEKKCVKCEMLEIIESIEAVVSSSFLDTSV